MDKFVMLSIIIVNWNTRGLLRDCLRSVYETTHNLNLEVFVVDNASSDGSPDMVRKEFPQAKLIKNTANMGFAKANNQAIKISQGDFILFLNTDVEVLNNCVNKMFHLMKENSKIAGLTCQSLYDDKKTVQHNCRRFPKIMTALFDNTFLGRWFPENKVIKSYRMRDWAFDNFREVDQPPMTCFMVRRKVVDTVGLLDENLFLFFNDVDWCFRIKGVGFKIFHTPDAQVIHYESISVNRLSDSYYYWHKNRFYYYRKHYGLYSVLLIKFVLIIDFLERTPKLPIKLLLNRIGNKEILSHFQSFWKIIKS